MSEDDGRCSARARVSATTPRRIPGPSQRAEREDNSERSIPPPHCNLVNAKRSPTGCWETPLVRYDELADRYCESPMQCQGYCAPRTLFQRPGGSAAPGRYLRRSAGAAATDRIEVVLRSIWRIARCARFPRGMRRNTRDAGDHEQRVRHAADPDVAAHRAIAPSIFTGIGELSQRAPSSPSLRRGSYGRARLRPRVPAPFETAARREDTGWNGVQNGIASPFAMHFSTISCAASRSSIGADPAEPRTRKCMQDSMSRHGTCEAEDAGRNAGRSAAPVVAVLRAASWKAAWP